MTGRRTNAITTFHCDSKSSYLSQSSLINAAALHREPPNDDDRPIRAAADDDDEVLASFRFRDCFGYRLVATYVGKLLETA